MEAAVEFTTGVGGHQDPQKATPELMGIPAEIRSQILALVYSATTIKILGDHDTSMPGSQPFLGFKFLIPSHYRPEAVLLTCTTLLREGIEVLYNDLTLELPLLYNYRVQWWHRVPQAVCERVRKVVLIRLDTPGQVNLRPVNLCALEAVDAVNYHTRINTAFESMPSRHGELYSWLGQHFQLPYCASIDLFLQTLNCRPQAKLTGGVVLTPVGREYNEMAEVDFATRKLSWWFGESRP